jgi:hypothetical protein
MYGNISHTCSEIFILWPDNHCEIWRKPQEDMTYARDLGEVFQINKPDIHNQLRRGIGELWTLLLQLKHLSELP